MHLATIWSQNYEALGSVTLTAWVAALPVMTLLALLGFLHVRAHLAALTSLGVAALVALVVYRMPATLLLGCLVMLQARFGQWMIPKP